MKLTTRSTPPRTPFDKKLRAVKADIAEEERAIASARRDRDVARAEGEQLLADVAARKEPFDERRLERLRGQAADATGRLRAAERRRRRVLAKRDRLAAARERWIVDQW